jgi:hypothetical protein
MAITGEACGSGIGVLFSVAVYPQAITAAATRIGTPRASAVQVPRSLQSILKTLSYCYGAVNPS